MTAVFPEPADDENDENAVDAVDEITQVDDSTDQVVDVVVEPGEEVVEEVVEIVEVTEAGDLADAELIAVIDEDEEEERAPREPSPYERPGDWFVVHTYAGYENKVKQNLASRVRSMNVEEQIFEVVIPMEDVIEFKGGRKVVVQKKVFPGYLLVRMALDDDSWYVVRNTPGVTGFVGNGARPTPLSRKEVENILGAGEKEEVGVEKQVRPRLEFEVGEQVRVTTGPFADFNGVDLRHRRRPLEAHRAGEHLRPGDPGRARARPGGQAVDAGASRADELASERNDHEPGVPARRERAKRRWRRRSSRRS